jgi:hypothetical protein
MKLASKALVVVALLALGAAPALALPPQAPSNDGTSHAPSTTPGPKAGLPAKARAYGRYCKDQSKKHVAGQKGTPFSKCVTDMAKLAHGQATNPRTACKDESKKHVAGQHGTPFSRCVAGGAKLLKDQQSESGSGDDGDGSSGDAGSSS